MDPVAVVDGVQLRPTTPQIQFTQQQTVALQTIDHWLEDEERDEFHLGGYAGTGKTTLIKEMLRRVAASKKYTAAVAAFTGKAVSVLRRKGVHRAQTLHSLLYNAEHDGKKIVFFPKESLDVNLVIVDEASMVSVELYRQLKRHNIKLLCVGDPAQLEPVGDNPDLMKFCDYTLTEIHRQAAKNPILRLSRAVREGRLDIPYGTWGGLTVAPDSRDYDITSFDVVICAKNATRHALNETYRRALDREGPPIVGDTVICLQNDSKKGVYNGLTLKIDSIGYNGLFNGGHTILADLSDDLGNDYFDIPMMSEFFGKDYKRSEAPRTRSIPFDFGYALTGHKSQGSEWRRVMVRAEKLYGIDFSRWLYTAVTRAAEELVLVI